MKLSAVTPLALAGTAVAWSGQPSRPYVCNTFNLPITVTNVPTVALQIPAVLDQYMATSLLNTLTDRVQSSAPPKTVNLTATYNILGELCTPMNPFASNTLQILTHGIGFNASYWDFYPSANASDSQYSYIAAATAAGYSCLTYNRLGIEGSTLANPITEVQIGTEREILAQITLMARAGKIPTQRQAPAKIVHVGHSFGSQITNALVGKYPDISDGVVLTGFSHINGYQALFAASSNFLIASMADPVRFPSSLYQSGYITWPEQWANQYAFFAYPEFAKDVLTDTENTKQPLTMGELFSMPIVGNNTATQFKNPVFYVNAEKDLIFCGSNCTGLIVPGSPAYTAFSGSSNISAIIVEGFGHALNVHLDAVDKVYAPITNWLQSHSF